MQLGLDLKNKRGTAGLSSLLATRTAGNLSTQTEREREREREGVKLLLLGARNTLFGCGGS